MEEKVPSAIVNENFINDIINEDLRQGKYQNKVHTRFPPEPNGYLHIGHAKAICLNFGLAQEYGGLCNLRFDDTNPSKEEEEYINSIIEDVRWLGFDWEDRLFYASDYFDQLYNYAQTLIRKGLAYVCELSQEEMRLYRGTPTEAGKLSPYASRTVEENLQLFEEMKAGKYADGEKVLRARIDMASSNFNMRDPVIYRIQHSHHQRTGDKWCIYPMYDYAHPISDALEGITHSICTLEFENHRPLYDWVLSNIDIEYPSRQIEFARLNITYTIMSKRKLRRLVEEGYVSGWDDPRMPTLSGMRRRGYQPQSLRNFCTKIGVAKANSTVEIELLEHCVREELNYNANRYMAVTNPIKITLVNYPENQTEILDAQNNPEKPEDGSHEVSFSRNLYIEADDFMEEPVKGFYRLSPGSEVRLKHAYIIKCEEVIHDENGKVIELHCSYDPTTKSGMENSHKKVKSTIHWVNAQDCLPLEARLYDHLFTQENPDDCQEGKDFTDYLNPDSLLVKHGYGEKALAKLKSGEAVQFMRIGYFVADPENSSEQLVFNRTVSLKDSWAKKAK